MIAEAGSATPGALMPLFSPERAASDDRGRRARRASARVTRSSIRPSSSSSRSPGRGGSDELGDRACRRRRPAPRRRRRGSAAPGPRSACSGTPAFEHGGADLRPAQILHDGDDAAGARRRPCASAGRPRRAPRGCRARSSAGRHRLRAAISAAMTSGWLLAGPSVAMILVRLMRSAQGSTSALVMRIASASASASFSAESA